ncbi:tRNA lysidine(34) synthetase TilS [Pelotomaculum terephthalicicum JT]|uniref:tRNA lysidine(34) synthetase TilS n=1 Tax=Pelotomaculum TaxID=191373 RepID=UPI0009C82619|nr:MULTISPECIES: tRNA lysidine(34) synthetase TilS [Pelotomaculum]MCG9968298.1 tRNA lysidine(34) synthetase TilS [Pelotomaculum terephthalicicum JT]OPX89497.1 MAG: tRNA(Ile)-lysidine synthase [Pelotomaculum sp. PtaB.Bin117]OPY63254.1 MAG: tRNA(Ile)-lysidine synthase [Pelotomaculum sp. PtaU1.Bin065]
MDLLREVRAYIERCRMVERGDRVVVAVSGGPDSVALLHLLHCLTRDLEISLHVAHLNHMFRGAESEADALFVAGVAGRYQLPATVEAVDVPAYRSARGLPAQVAAREVRYRFLEEVAKKNGAGKIALAHQADDQAETILINFLRGAGTTGLKGIMPVRDNYIIRPLLAIRRSQIERYCAEMNLPFRNDSSNLKPVYLRNRVRRELIPLLKNAYNPGLTASLLRLGEICREEDGYLEEQALKAYRQAGLNDGDGVIRLSLARLREMPKAVVRRVVRLAWRDLTGSGRDLSFTHTKAVLDLLDSEATGLSASLPAGIAAIRSYAALELRAERKNPEPGHYLYPLKVPGSTYIPELDRTVRASLTAVEDAPEPRFLPATEALLDFAKLPPQIFVRRRLKGDVFCPYGHRSAVKLKDFLIKQKVPQAQRDCLPLVCTPEEIIWIGGIRVGEKWKIDNDTAKILHLELVRGAPDSQESGDRS